MLLPSQWKIRRVYQISACMRPNLVLFKNLEISKLFLDIYHHTTVFEPHCFCRDLHGNGLHGSIPSTYGDMLSGLEDLDLSNNRLNGALPENLGKLEKLWTLKLSHNQFSGSIPRMIFRNLSRLVTMDLSHNTFSGKLPNLTSVASLNRL